MLAQNLFTVVGNFCTVLANAVGPQLFGHPALGIIGTADKGAKAPGLEAEAAILAFGAFARVNAFLFGRENMGFKMIVQGFENHRSADIDNLFGAGVKVLPEIAEDRFPFDLAGGNTVKLFF